MIVEIINEAEEVIKEYEEEEGTNLLSRAKLTAEIWTRDKEGEFTARIQA